MGKQIEYYEYLEQEHSAEYDIKSTGIFGTVDSFLKNKRI